jgi:hypothetical protein
MSSRVIGVSHESEAPSRSGYHLPFIAMSPSVHCDAGRSRSK